MSDPEVTEEQKRLRYLEAELSAVMDGLVRFLEGHTTITELGDCVKDLDI